MQTPPEIRRLLDASDEPVRTLLLCAVLTGMRRPPSALAGEVRHTEVPALASDDRPSADAASGVGQALEPLPGRARLLQPRWRADQSRHLRSAGLAPPGAPAVTASSDPVSRPAPHYASLLIAQGLTRSTSRRSSVTPRFRPRSTVTDTRCPTLTRLKHGSSTGWCSVRPAAAAQFARPLTRCSGCKMVAETRKGSAAATANPLSLRGCGGWI